MKGYEAAAGRRHLRSADTMKLLVARANCHLRQRLQFRPQPFGTVYQQPFL